jgi:hypothetical protein
MEILYIILIVIGALIALWFVWGIVSPHIWEQPQYELKEKEGRFELRRYQDAKILSTTTSKFNNAFSVLSSYIFGKNKEKEKIAMTSPVLTEMGNDDTMKMIFFIPKKFENIKMPTPYSDDIEFSTQKARDVAVIRFHGLMTINKREKYLDKLLEKLEKKGIKTKGSAFYMNYSDPFVPPPLRINEIGIEIYTE